MRLSLYVALAGQFRTFFSNRLRNQIMLSRARRTCQCHMCARFAASFAQLLLPMLMHCVCDLRLWALKGACDVTSSSTTGTMCNTLPGLLSSRVRMCVRVLFCVQQNVVCSEHDGRESWREFFLTCLAFYRPRLGIALRSVYNMQCRVGVEWFENE